MHLSVATALYLIVPLLCLPGLSFQKDTPVTLTQDMTLSLRGVGMLLIVFVHAIKDFVDLQTFFIYVSGVLGVAACFLVSGYGLHKSFMRKEHYLKGFLQTKFLRMLIPYTVCYIAYLLFSVFQCDTPTFAAIGLELITLQLDGLLLWYLKVQLLCYVIFYLCYRYIPNSKARMLAVFALIFLWMVSAIALGLGTSWYNTCLFFPLGLLLAEHEKPVLTLLRKPVTIVLNTAATILLFMVIYLFGRFNLDILYDWIYMLVFNAALIGMLMYVRGGWLLRAFGKYSMEIYLLHVLLLTEDTFAIFRADKGVSYLLIVFLSLSTAVPLFYICNKIMKSINGAFSLKSGRKLL